MLKAADGMRGNVGFVLGYDEWLSNPRLVSVLWWPRTGEFTIGARWSRKHRLQAPDRGEEGCTLRVAHWDGHAVVSVDGKTLFAGELPAPEGWRAGRPLGIGGTYQPGVDGSVLVRDLRVRRLKTKPDALQGTRE